MKKALFLFSFLLIFMFCFSAPAMPGYRPLFQPDGTSFIAEGKGDEFFHYAVTEDGYSVVRDAEGWWTYAQKIDGLLMPSAFIAGKDDSPYERFLSPDAEAVEKLPAMQQLIDWKNMIDMSKVTKDDLADTSVLIVLGCFDDSTYIGIEQEAGNPVIAAWNLKAGYTSASAGGTAHDSLYWDSVFFSDSPGSFRSYYKEISFGNWIPSGIVVGPVTAGGVYSAYNNGDERNYCRNFFESNSMTAGARMRAFGDSIPNYDTDNDGFVDHCIVVHCGGDQAATYDERDMWAQRILDDLGTSWSTQIRTPSIIGEFADSRMNDFSANYLDPQFVMSKTIGVGIYCHETFHQFEAPDLYDYEAQGRPVHVWSLMTAGAWYSNGIQPASQPPHVGALLAYNFDGYLTAGSNAFMPESYRLDINNDGRYAVVGLSCPDEFGGPRMACIQNSTFQSAQEWFIIENRCPRGYFETVLPEHGILIIHYDPSEITSSIRWNEGPSDENYYTYWVEEIGFDPVVHEDNPSDIIDRNTNRCAFYAGDDFEFTNSTFAATNVNGSTISFGPSILSVSAPGDTMWFTVGNCSSSSSALFVYKADAVVDTVTGHGNDNGVADADEIFDFDVTLSNIGGNASSVNAVLTCKNGLATVIDGNASYGTINTNANVTNTADPFRIKINPGVAQDTLVVFNMAITSSNGSHNIDVALKLNSARVVDKISLGTISPSLSDAAAIDLAYSPLIGDWMFIGGGTAWAGGAKRIVWFDMGTMGSVIKDSTGYIGDHYIYGIDHDSELNLWYSNGDSCYKYVFNGATYVLDGSMRWHNTDYSSGNPNEYCRGICLKNNDSLYTYYQRFEPALEESIFGETKNLGGTASCFEAKPIVDGAEHGGSWCNGRGMDYDGKCFWTNDINRYRIYRRDENTLLKIFEMPSPDCYELCFYDLCFQSVGPDGTDAIVNYGQGNKYYLWTTNMDNGDAYKVDVTDIVLPCAVDLDVATSTANNVIKQTTLYWHPNPESDYVDHYIIYRDTDPDFYPSSACSVGTTADTVFTNSPPITKDVTYYYKVRAVNWHGYSNNTSYESFQADFTTAKHDLAVSAAQNGTDVILTWRYDDYNGIEWKVFRTSDKTGERVLAGSIQCSKFFKASEYRMTDSEIAESGIYKYSLELELADGSIKYFNDVRFKYINAYQFGIADPVINPMSGGSIMFGIDRSDDIELKLYNITGSVVTVLEKGHFNPGYYSAAIPDGISSGTYFAVLQQGERISKKRISIIR